MTISKSTREKCRTSPVGQGRTSLGVAVVKSPVILEFQQGQQNKRAERKIGRLKQEMDCV